MVLGKAPVLEMTPDLAAICFSRFEYLGQEHRSRPFGEPSENHSILFYVTELTAPKFRVSVPVTLSPESVTQAALKRGILFSKFNAKMWRITLTVKCNTQQSSQLRATTSSLVSDAFHVKHLQMRTG